MNLLRFRPRRKADPGAAMVMDRFARAQNPELLREWHEAMLVFSGRQWETYNMHTGAVESAKAPSWRVRLVSNLVLPAVIRIHAKLTQRDPVLLALPADSSDRAHHAAKSAERLLSHLWRELGTTLKIHALAKWMIITGTAFLKVYWDPRAGDRLPGTNLFTGEVAHAVLSPFELYPEPGARSLDQARWVIHASARTREWVRHQYGLDLQPEKTTTFPGAAPPGAELVTVLEYWERPTRDHPDGRVITVAGGRVLDEKPNPYDHRDFPFVQFDYIKVPGSFFARGAVADMIPLQREYNKGRSQVLEVRNLMSQPQWLIPDGSIDPETITSEPGLRLPYNPNMGKPERVPGPELPEYVTEDIQRSKRDMDTISGIGEISQSQWPLQVSSGLAIAILREQEDLRFRPVVKRFERQLARAGALTLRVARQFYTETRTIRVLGGDGRYDIYRLTAKDLEGPYDVVVQPESVLPESRLAKQTYLLELWKNKIITDRHQILQLLEFGQYQPVPDETELDRRHAGREHVRLLTGRQVPVERWHNHAEHILVHNRLRKSVEYEKLPDGVKAVIDEHVAQHEQWLARLQPATKEDDADAGSDEPSGRGEAGRLLEYPAGA